MKILILFSIFFVFDLLKETNQTEIKPKQNSTLFETTKPAAPGPTLITVPPAPEASTTATQNWNNSLNRNNKLDSSGINPLMNGLSLFNKNYNLNKKSGWKLYSGKSQLSKSQLETNSSNYKSNRSFIDFNRRNILIELSKIGRDTSESNNSQKNNQKNNNKIKLNETSSISNNKSQSITNSFRKKSKSFSGINGGATAGVDIGGTGGRLIKGKNSIDLEEIDDYDKYVSLNNENKKNIDETLLVAASDTAKTSTSNLNERKSARKSTATTNSNSNNNNNRLPPTPRGVFQIKTIYNSLRNGEDVYEEKQINTIRYVPSIKVESSRKMYFLFNLSLLTNTEKILKSELYINRKYIKQRLTFNLHYFLYSTFKKTSQNTSTSAAMKNNNNRAGASMTIDLKNFRNFKSYGKQNIWQSFNILESINSYLTVRNSRQRLANLSQLVKQSNYKNNSIYYTFDNENESQSQQQVVDTSDNDELVLIMETTFNTNTRNKRLLISKPLPDLINPYLMIYSNEDETNMKKFFQTRVASVISDNVAGLQESNSNLTNTRNLNSNKEINKQIKQNINGNGNQVDEMSRLKIFESQVDQLNKIDSNGKNMIPQRPPASALKQSSISSAERSPPQKDLIYFSTTNYKLFKLPNKPNRNKQPQQPKSSVKYELIKSVVSNKSAAIGVAGGTGALSEQKSFNKFYSLNSNQLINNKNESFDVIELIFKTNENNSSSNDESKITKRLNKRETDESNRTRKLSPSFEDIYEDGVNAGVNAVVNTAGINDSYDDEDQLEKLDENKFDKNQLLDLDYLNDRSGSSSKSNKKFEKCSKRPIIVDFGDLSFSDWILEPKSFQSNYCTGLCKFPFSQKMSYSNYATLQSILNSLNINSRNNPPELCCSPSKTESLPILYIDKNSIDYVVKLLPDMIVNDCSCR